MNIRRREFLKLSAAAGTVAAFGGLGFDMAKPTAARAQLLKMQWAKETTSICPYCGVGCGLLVHTDTMSKRAINVEGDPDHPINEGSLCAKGASVWALNENEKRVRVPMYRAPYSDKWERKDWDWMLTTIAKRIKETRDNTFTKTNAKGQTVNRCDGIAHVGSATIDNEECWVLQAFVRSLGLVYIEHQARI